MEATRMRRNLDQVPTSAISFVETEHRRLRQQTKGDQQERSSSSNKV